MNAPDPLPPIPKDFGFGYVARYAGWWLWTNANTIGGAIFSSLGAAIALLDNPPEGQPHYFSHQTLAMILFVYGLIAGTIARVKGQNPPGPPPTSKVSPQ